MAVYVTSLTVDSEYRYPKIGDWFAVPLVMTLAVENVLPEKWVLEIPDTHLPFGFLTRIVLDTGATATPKHRWRISKTTGDGTSKPAKRPSTSATFGDAYNDADGVDEHFSKLKTKTGHDLRFRTMFAETILRLYIEFYETPPPSFTIKFHLVNATEEGTGSVKDALASKARVKFLFPPVPPRVRTAHAAAAIRAAGVDLGSGAGSSAGGDVEEK